MITSLKVLTAEEYYQVKDYEKAFVYVHLEDGEVGTAVWAIDFTETSYRVYEPWGIASRASCNKGASKGPREA